MNFSGVELSGNEATSHGGVLAATDAQLQINGVSVTNNRSGNNGGAFYLCAVDMTGTGNNVFSGNKAVGHGGAIYAVYRTVSNTEKQGTVVNMTGGSFSNNSAMGGGAISIRSASEATFDGTTFSGNTASGFADKEDGDGEGGGAIYVGYGNVTLTNVTMSCNTAPFGGAVNTVASEVTVSGGSFTQNMASISGSAI
jgi:predicted outer membrane repeat protein